MVDSRFVEINGSRIHYVEEGDGDPIIFLHGVPTSSYLWRNIIPTLSDKAHCIAPDLIGMGESDKPDIQYNFFDHVEYIEEFIGKLDLTNITLVVQGLGSAIGFDYAINHPDNVKAIAFCEAHVRPINSWDMLSLPIQSLFHSLSQSAEKAYKAIVEDNFLVDKLFFGLTSSSLSKEAKKQYKKPFAKAKDRKLLWQYIQDFSITGAGYKKVIDRVTTYSKYLTKSSIPKLMLYTTPGFLTTMDTVQWCSENFPNLQLGDLEDGLHLPQESNPQMFGQILRDWYLKI